MLSWRLHWGKYASFLRLFIIEYEKDTAWRSWYKKSLLWRLGQVKSINKKTVKLIIKSLINFKWHLYKLKINARLV